MDEQTNLNPGGACGAAPEIPEAEPEAAPEWTGIVRELGELGAGAILTESALAKLFARHPVSVKRAVARGELPSPTRLFGAPCWTCGSIVRFVEARLEKAERDAERARRRIREAGA